MCKTANVTFTCTHTETITTRCGYNGRFSNIIPQRCLRNFKPAENENGTGLCIKCAIKKHNERWERYDQKAKKLNGQV